jgi:hypothetical protein
VRYQEGETLGEMPRLLVSAKSRWKSLVGDQGGDLGVMPRSR